LIPDKHYISSILDGVDGILLPGSDSDVDPIRYGENPRRELGDVHPIKDQTDLVVLDEVESRRTPLFAICFGMQILNVSRGGTLIQDIASQFPQSIKHEQGAPRDRHSHTIRLLRGSVLSELNSGVTALVNSHHHQAVNDVGRDLIATAWSSDGIVEAIEDPRNDRSVLGVQWHPELAWERDELSKRLFDRFVADAARHQQNLQPNVLV
jgi:putative glutamine amidotransferase